jgi:transposase-like protein
LVDLVRSGRATVAEAASHLGVTPSTAYYWTRAAGATDAERRSLTVTDQAASGPTFVRVVPSGAVATAIVVRIGAAEIQVRRGFDPELLRAVVEALDGGA